jgi:hypothetical protein
VTVRPLYGPSAHGTSTAIYRIDEAIAGYEWVIPFEPSGRLWQLQSASWFWTASAASLANAATLQFRDPVVSNRLLVATTGNIGALGAADTCYVTFGLHGALASHGALFGNVAAATAPLPDVWFIEPFTLQAAFDSDGAGASSLLQLVFNIR